MSRSPDLTWPQVFLSWALYDLPPTLLLLTFLSRRVRAVGPLILTFMLLALIGSDVLVSVVGSQGALPSRRDRDDLARSVSAAPARSSPCWCWASCCSRWSGWTALIWIGRRYQAKKISDESVTVDAVWMLFALVHSVNLVFGRPLWMLGGCAAFGGTTRSLHGSGSRWLGRGDAGASPDDADPAACCDRSRSAATANGCSTSSARYWRRVGSIQMIAGVDLVSRTVEPHEFLDFVSGRLSRRFIDGEESLNRRMTSATPPRIATSVFASTSSSATTTPGRWCCRGSSTTVTW